MRLKMFIEWQKPSYYPLESCWSEVIVLSYVGLLNGNLSSRVYSSQIFILRGLFYFSRLAKISIAWNNLSLIIFIGPKVEYWIKSRFKVQKKSRKKP